MTEREDVQVIGSMIERIADREALIEINRLCIKRIREVDYKLGLVQAATWTVGDRAAWENRQGRRVTGRVFRVNAKTLGIYEDGSNTRWRVAYNLVERLSGVQSARPAEA